MLERLLCMRASLKQILPLVSRAISGESFPIQFSAQKHARLDDRHRADQSPTVFVYDGTILPGCITRVTRKLDSFFISKTGGMSLPGNSAIPRAWSPLRDRRKVTEKVNLLAPGCY